jgi:hypothetical protein
LAVSLVLLTALIGRPWDFAALATALAGCLIARRRRSRRFPAVAIAASFACGRRIALVVGCVGAILVRLRRRHT